MAVPHATERKDPMTPKEKREQSLTRVIREMGETIRRQARGRWEGVRTAQRKEGGRHVWRFRPAGDAERFLHVSRRAMVEGEDPAGTLLKQLGEARWLDRLQEGPETAFVLSPAGRLRPWPKP